MKREGIGGVRREGVGVVLVLRREGLHIFEEIGQRNGVVIPRQGQHTGLLTQIETGDGIGASPLCLMDR